MLQHILDKATPGVNTAARLVRVVWRLLLVVKQRCSLNHSVSMELTSPPISPPFLRSLRGAARSICTPRHAPLPNKSRASFGNVHQVVSMHRGRSPYFLLTNCLLNAHLPDNGGNGCCIVF